MMIIKSTHFQLFITAILVLTFAMPLVTNAPSVEAADEELVPISFFLNHEDDDTDTHYMNTVSGTPADQSQTTPDTFEWTFGWWDDNIQEVVDTNLHTDLYIEGNYGSDDRVLVNVYIENPSSFNDIDVTMELWDDGNNIADITKTLASGFPNGDSSEIWDLDFNENADGDNFHTFDAGHTFEIHVSTEPATSLNIEYRSGTENPANINFEGCQISDPSFYLIDAYRNNMQGEEFTPVYPDFTDLDVINIGGTFVDTFGVRDIAQVWMGIQAPWDDEPTYVLVETNPEAFSGEGLDPIPSVRYDENWTYGDAVPAIDELEDAGTYYVSINITDQNGNEFFYVEEMFFDMSKYGTYIVFTPEQTKDQSKSAGPGESMEFDVEVFNAGVADGDTITLAISDLPNDWEAFVAPDQFVLNSGESGIAVLNVTLPEDADEGDFTKIELRATSTLSEGDDEYEVAIDTVDATARVTAKADVAVYFNSGDSKDDDSEYIDEQSKNGNAEKGIDREFNFRVKNDSPQEDNITLYLSGTPNDWDAWIIDPDTGEEIEYVVIDDNSEETLWVRVNPATGQGASDVAYFEITGESSIEPDVEDTAFLNVTRTLGVVVRTDFASESKVDILKPGIPNTLNFVVENSGEDTRTFEILIDDSQVNPEGWNVELDSADTTIEIPKGDTHLISVEVTPNTNAVTKDGGYEIIITARDVDDAGVKFEHNVFMNVETIYKLEMEILQREKEIESSGDSVEYIVRVVNTGNSEVIINIQVDSKSEKDWNAQLDKTADSFQPGAEKQFILTVTSPDPVDNKEKCTVQISASVLNHDETKKTVSTKTEVNKGSMDALIDTLQEYSWLFLLLSVVVIIAVVLYYHSQRYDDEYEDDEEYYEEEDDWE